MALMRDAVLEERRRFVEFKEANTGLTDRMLSRRLAELVAEGYLERVPDGSYAPTERGAALYPVLLALAEFGITQYPERVFADGKPHPLGDYTASLRGTVVE